MNDSVPEVGGSGINELSILMTEGVLMLIFGLVFAVVWVAILFHMIRIHTRIAEALEKMVEQKAGAEPDAQGAEDRDP